MRQTQVCLFNCCCVFNFDNDNQVFWKKPHVLQVAQGLLFLFGQSEKSLDLKVLIVTSTPRFVNNECSFSPPEDGGS